VTENHGVDSSILSLATNKDFKTNNLDRQSSKVFRCAFLGSRWGHTATKVGFSGGLMSDKDWMQGAAGLAFTA
jgi:hypothetical protein